MGTDFWNGNLTHLKVTELAEVDDVSVDHRKPNSTKIFVTRGSVTNASEDNHMKS